MPTGERLEAIVRQFDRALARLERDAIVRLDGALRESFLRLERELRSVYEAARAAGASESLAFREARARALLTQVRAALDLTSAAPAVSTFQTLSTGAAAVGAQNATVMLGAYGQTTVLSTVASLGAAARATNASARLAQHGTDFAMKAERIIIDGIIRGRGFAPTARELRRETGILRHEAERIVRTETVAAADEARRNTYRESGVELVQHMATMDDRLCGYCSSRAGKVYKINEAEVPLHPNCRCFLAPWRKEWQELGLTDDAWAAEHKRKSQERATEPPKTGAAPSERWRGLDEAPRPVWTP
jgi:SPP1 gp7 family putative phage head morphogenesis protein